MRGAADDDSRGYASLNLDLVVEKHGPVGVGLGRRVAHELERLPGKVEQQLAARVLQDRPELDEVGHEPPQPGVGRQPAQRERHRDARALVRDAERPSNGEGRPTVEDVHVHVRVVAGCGQEPRLHGAPGAHALDPPASLRQPDVAEAAAEEPALALALGSDAERAQTALHDAGVDALAVVGTDDLVQPVGERGQAQAPKRPPPGAAELGVRRPDPKLIRPRSRPAAAIAASALVTSSGTIWERSIPAWAKFSRK